MRTKDDTEKLSKAAQSSKSGDYVTLVLYNNIPSTTGGQPWYEQRDFFRFLRGKLDLFDRIGKGLGQVKLTEEELDFIKIMENPPYADNTDSETTNSLALCGVKLRCRKLHYRM